MTVYLDSSALVKLVLVDEEPQEELAAMLDVAGPVATSRLTYVETRAAIAGACRVGRLTADGHDRAVEAFESIWEGIAVIDLTQSVAKDAGVVAETFGLRAGDAIQLASIRRLHSDTVPMIAWDTRLRAAATASGYRCYPSAV